METAPGAAKSGGGIVLNGCFLSEIAAAFKTWTAWLAEASLDFHYPDHMSFL